MYLYFFLSLYCIVKYCIVLSRHILVYFCIVFLCVSAYVANKRLHYITQDCVRPYVRDAKCYVCNGALPKSDGIPRMRFCKTIG